MKTRPILRKIFFISLPGLFVFFLLLEIILRSGDFLYTVYHHPKKYTVVKEGAQDRFNILCIGDSFTYGMGADLEDSYPRQLERLLQENVSKDINVINGARFANTSSLLQKRLQEDIDEYYPNLLIVMIGCNNKWNFKDSSYFLLKKDLNLPERFERVLSDLRVYKLVKIGWENFRHKIDERNKSVSDRMAAKHIEPESVNLYRTSNSFFSKGIYDLAEEKMKEALIADRGNYYAHIGLARIYTFGYKKYLLAKELIWQAATLIDEWNTDLLGEIIGIIIHFDDTIVDRRSELIELKKFFQGNIMNRGKKNKLVKIINARLHLLSGDYDIFEKVLEYDLKVVIDLARENDISVILQTYPHIVEIVDKGIRKTSAAYNIPLVDNVRVFQEIEKQENRDDFFIKDGHCNAKGYRVIAENVYKELINGGLLLTIQK